MPLDLEPASPLAPTLREQLGLDQQFCAEPRKPVLKSTVRDNKKAAVREFWERTSSGEELYLNSRDRSGSGIEDSALSAARVIWPRALIKRFFPSYGLFMLITATK
jgi:hypothetical protein